MLKDDLLLIFRNLTYRKLRSWLTIIGIVIGIAAIVSLISLGRGFENAIEQEFNRMGVKSIRIAPQGFMGPGTGLTILSQRDVDEIKKIKGIDYVEPNFVDTAAIVYNKQTLYLSLRGIPSDMIERDLKDLDLPLATGEPIKSKEKYVVILGNNVATDLFDKNIYVKNKILINNHKFKVKAILKKQGSNIWDNAIIIPIDTMQEILNQPDRISLIRAQSLSKDNVEEVAEKIKSRLRRLHNKDMVTVYTSKQVLSKVLGILGIVRIIVGGIAAISLLVGGIGIMNSMYTSVLERTRQIGTMKAIGATNKEIITMFVTESGLMGLMGGLIGIFLGKSLAYSAQLITEKMGFYFIKVTIDLKLILFALVFSFLLGLLFGTLPAIKAAKLKPVEALHYE